MSKYTETYLRISVTELDGNVPHELVFESNSLNARNCLHNRRLAVRDISNGTCTRRSMDVSSRVDYALTKIYSSLGFE